MVNLFLDLCFYFVVLGFPGRMYVRVKKVFLDVKLVFISYKNTMNFYDVNIIRLILVQLVYIKPELNISGSLP